MMRTGKKGIISVQPRRNPRPWSGSEVDVTTGDKIVLRPIEANDVALYRASLERPELRAFRLDPAPVPDEVVREVFGAILASQGYDTMAYVITERSTGRALGYIALLGLDPAARTAEVTTYVVPDAQGTGLARAAMSALLAHAFGPLGLDTVWMTHHADNERWRPGAERLGFVETRRARGARAGGKHVDRVTMEVSRDTFTHRQ